LLPILVKLGLNLLRRNAHLRMLTDNRRVPCCCCTCWTDASWRLWTAVRSLVVSIHC